LSQKFGPRTFRPKRRFIKWKTDLIVVSVVIDDRLGADDDAAAARLRHGDQEGGFAFNVVLLPRNLWTTIKWF
jgi:hypothetical protein